jgi:transcription initiation factor TFIID TATA-box-binding protein
MALWEGFPGRDADELAEMMLGIVPECISDTIPREPSGCGGGDAVSCTTIHNMVSTSIVHSSNMPINLSLLSVLLPCSTYDRKRFAAITIRLDNPRCTALLFTSGKLVVTGVKSW